MTSSSASAVDPDSSQLHDALDRAVALLAVDGRLAGPVSRQEGLDDLIPGPDALGVLAPIVGGGFLVSVVMPSVFMGLGTDSAAVDTLSGALSQAASDLGVELGEAVRFERPEELTTRLADANFAMTAVVGAGVFEGDAVVATLGALLSGTAASAAPSNASASTSSSAGSSFRSADAAVLERGLQLLADIELTVTAELGRARMPVGELLDLQPGAIIELDREAGVPIDLLVNGTLFARGEVVVVDDCFALRVWEIVTDEETR